MLGLVVREVWMRRVFDREDQLLLVEMYLSSCLCVRVLMVGCEFIAPFDCRDDNDEGLKRHSNRLSTVPSSKHNDVLQHRHFQPLRRRSTRLPKHHPLPPPNPVLFRRRYPARQSRHKIPRHTIHRLRHHLLQSRHPIHSPQHNVL